MNDITKITVAYQLPTITADLAEIEKGVSELEEQYTGWLVNSADIPDAKKTVSSLNKTSKALSDKRIEIVKAIKSPIDAFETSIKALCKRVDAVSDTINTQLKDYETKRTQDREIEIRAFPEWVGDYMIFDPKWTNISVTDKAIKDGMNAQKQFFTNNSLLISTTCNAKGLKSDKYLSMLAQHSEVATIVQIIENDAEVKETYHNTATPSVSMPPQPIPTLEEQTEVYELTLKLTATKPQLNALKAKIIELGIQYEKIA